MSDRPPDICPCREDLFPVVHRRGLLLAAASTVSLAATRPAAAATPPGAVHYDVADDPTKVQGRPAGEDGGYGTRSQFETAVRSKPGESRYTTSTRTPLAALLGNVTPSGLHYERHHNGIPTIDPAKHSLVVHGLLATPLRFTMADVHRLPAISRRHFIECSGNSASEWSGPHARTVQAAHGLLSTSEWTGVRFADLARLVGLKPEGTWVLAEGADGAVMTRSIPIEKMMRDAMLAYGQNGEAIRPEQGYPLRLLLPGYEGNTNIKWLQSLEVSEAPFMSREETSKYTDLMPDGKAWQFVFEMDAKSIITTPSGDMRLPGPGYYEINGLAWSGRGRVTAVDVSTDGGHTWQEAQFDGPPEPICTVRFRLPWRWDGHATVLLSRCRDETGYVQPTREQLVAQRGLNAIYHYNGIQPWRIAESGAVANVAA